MLSTRNEYQRPIFRLYARQPYGALYVGGTGNLPARIYLHRTDVVEGFSSLYRIHRLVYFEQHETAYAAITREKQIKKWRRDWKVELIEKANPNWEDFFDTIAS